MVENINIFNLNSKLFESKSKKVGLGKADQHPSHDRRSKPSIDEQHVKDFVTLNLVDTAIISFGSVQLILQTCLEPEKSLISFRFQNTKFFGKRASR